MNPIHRQDRDTPEEQGWKYLISSDDFTCSFVSFRGLAYVHFQDPSTYLEKGLDQNKTLS